MPQPEIVILGVEWQPRALMRAELLEEGFEVAATDTWPMMLGLLRPGSLPAAAIVDLQGLPEPEQVLHDLRLLMRPDRVIVLAAMGTLGIAEIERLGFRAIKRPIAIKDVVAAARQAVRTA